jgi:hypothetical protein
MKEEIMNGILGLPIRFHRSGGATVGAESNTENDREEASAAAKAKADRQEQKSLFALQSIRILDFREDFGRGTLGRGISPETLLPIPLPNIPLPPPVFPQSYPVKLSQTAAAGHVCRQIVRKYREMNDLQKNQLSCGSSSVKLSQSQSNQFRGPDPTIQ